MRWKEDVVYIYVNVDVWACVPDARREVLQDDEAVLHEEGVLRGVGDDDPVLCLVECSRQGG